MIAGMLATVTSISLRRALRLNAVVHKHALNDLVATGIPQVARVRPSHFEFARLWFLSIVRGVECHPDTNPIDFQHGSGNAMRNGCEALREDCARCSGSKHYGDRMLLMPKNSDPDVAHFCARDSKFGPRLKNEVIVEKHVQVIHAIVFRAFPGNVVAEHCFGKGDLEVGDALLFALMPDAQRLLFVI
jgi:hypothetical protein